MKSETESLTVKVIKSLSESLNGFDVENTSWTKMKIKHLFNSGSVLQEVTKKKRKKIIFF